MEIPDNLNLDYYELILTEDCNLRCTYCFDDYFSDRKGCNYESNMSIDILDELFNFIFKTKTKDINKIIKINFFGGEPFVNFNFMKAFAAKANNEFNFNYKFSINTNGYNLNSEKINWLIDNKVSTAISIDGMKKSHDKNRITKEGNPSWDNIMKSIPELLAKMRNRINHDITFMYTVTEDTIDQLYDSYHFFNRLGVIISLQYETEKEKSKEFYEKFEGILTQLFVHDHVQITSTIENWAFNENQHQSNNFCFIPNSNVSIAPNGDLFFCHRLVPKMYNDKEEKAKISYGNIIDGYTNTELYKIFLDRTDFNKFKKNKKCDTCNANFWCKGGCMASHFNYTNMKDINALNPELCKINIMITNVVDKVIKYRENNRII